LYRSFQMIHEKRNQQKPIPDNLDEIISVEQLATITKLEAFGWQLFFIRRPTPSTILPLMKCPLSSECYTAVIDKDGSVIRDHNILIRNDDRHLH
jgi:hypothetical protein